jgi:hypothetical protein
LQVRRWCVIQSARLAQERTSNRFESRDKQLRANRGTEVSIRVRIAASGCVAPQSTRYPQDQVTRNTGTCTGWHSAHRIASQVQENLGFEMRGNGQGLAVPG